MSCTNITIYAISHLVTNTDFLSLRILTCYYEFSLVTGCVVVVLEAITCPTPVNNEFILCQRLTHKVTLDIIHAAIYQGFGCTLVEQ